MIRYYKVNNNVSVTHLKSEVYYNKGGENVWNGRRERRGYYISVSPVKRERGCESYTAWTGLKQCVLEVKRSSSKKANEAEEYFKNHVEEFIQTHFNGFDVDMENYIERRT